MDYPWIKIAKSHIGLKEIPGKEHNPVILTWLKKLKAWWMDDETPWCAVYVAHCFRECNLAIPKLYMRASEWSNDWGVKLVQPMDGCVAVFTRSGGGHVGFVMGITPDNFLLILGGNQGDQVNIRKFSRDRVVGYYWPKDYALPTARLSILSSTAEVSTREA